MLLLAKARALLKLQKRGRASERELSFLPKVKSLNDNDRDQDLRARETELPTQSLVFSKSAGRQPG